MAGGRRRATETEEGNGRRMEMQLKIQVEAGGVGWGGGAKTGRDGIKRVQRQSWDLLGSWFLVEFAWTLKDNLESGSTQI